MSGGELAPAQRLASKLRFSAHDRTHKFKAGDLDCVTYHRCSSFLPPLFAGRLEAWDLARQSLSADTRVIEQCGIDARVELSRWFYTYRFSGENAYAKFRGQVKSATCDRKLTVELRRQAGVWKDAVVVVN